MSPVERLYRKAMELPGEERERLTEWLLNARHEVSCEKEPGYDEAWDAEIKRRIDDMESGEEPGIPLEEAMTQIFGRP
jgi:putative addiction module component (TIGR02574 family)